MVAEKETKLEKMGAWGYSAIENDSAYDAWHGFQERYKVYFMVKPFSYYEKLGYKQATKKQAGKYSVKFNKYAKAQAAEHVKSLKKVPAIEQAALGWLWWVGLVLLAQKAGIQPTKQIREAACNALEDEISVLRKVNLPGWKNPKKRIAVAKRELRQLRK